MLEIYEKEPKSKIKFKLSLEVQTGLTDVTKYIVLKCVDDEGKEIEGGHLIAIHPENLTVKLCRHVSPIFGFELDEEGRLEINN